MKASDIPKLGKAFWLILIGGQKRGLISKIIKRYRYEGKNYKGEKFAKYSKEYAEAKASGDKELLGIVGQNQESYSSTPDMTLTGKLMLGLQPKTADENSGTFGWVGPNAKKVRDLAGKKNYEIVGLSGGKVLADKEEQFIVDEMNKAIKSNIKKYEKNTITINLGK